MKTNHSGKSRGGGHCYGRKASAVASRKRLRRLHPPVDDDEEDEDTEVELLPGGSLPTTEGKRRREDDDAAADNDGDLVFVDFDSAPPTANLAGPEFDLYSICTRDLEQQPLHSDELDQLQFELEKSLTESILRKRNLLGALKQLTGPTSAVGSKAATSSSATATTVSSAKASAASSVCKRKFPKSQQPFAKRPATAGVYASKRNRGAGNKGDRTSHNDSTPSCSRFYYYAQQNHQMPDKFWSFVDEYAGPVERGSLESMRKLVNECDFQAPESECYYKIPESKCKRRPSSAASMRASPNHQPDHDASKPEGSTNSKSKKFIDGRRSSAIGDDQGHGIINPHSGDATKPRSKKRSAACSSTAKKIRDNSRAKNVSSGDNLKSQNNSNCNSDKNGYSLGPITERLVQALIEDYTNGSAEILAPSKTGPEDTTATAKGGPSPCSNAKAMMKTLNLGNLKALENRIKKELIDEGLLDPEEDQAGRSNTGAHGAEAGQHDRQGDGTPHGFEHIEDQPNDDEVTAELKRRQRELLFLQRSNHERLRALLAAAEAQADRIRKEDTLRAANEEVLSLCSRYYGVAPTSRKPSSKAERDSLWKALKEREKAASLVNSGQ